jgi:type VI secretion system protein ImpG
MQASAERLKSIFQQEISALRDEAREFAQDYPEQADALGFHSGRSQDPHVEMLMQSFSYLTGRLRYQLELDQAQLPNALMADLYPHMEGPLPSMLVASIDVALNGQKYGKGVALARARQVTAKLPGDQGGQLTCTFRTGWETLLWPLRVRDVAITSPDDYSLLLRDHPNLRSVLRVTIDCEGSETLAQLQPRQLRFFLSPEGGPAHALHALLSAHLEGVAVHEDPQAAGHVPRMLPTGCLRWCGFDEDESLLPGSDHAHPAYRVLQEYFAFPEKFLFFEIDQLAVEQAGRTLDVLFLLDTPSDASLRLTPNALALNCVPLVNLYAQRIDPLHLDHTRYEYRLTGDVAQHRNCEIYRIEQLQAIRPDGPPRPISPYFAMDHFQRIEAQDYFYFMRREESQLSRTGGTELYVSFLDANFQVTDPADEIIVGSALCTNRRTPERLRVGENLQVEGASSNASMHVVLRPTAHQSPTLTGTRPWALASQLSLNHLSLAGGEQALATLKELLRLHVGPSSTLGHRVIDGLREIHCRPLMRWVQEAGRRAYVQGLDITIMLDHTHFEESSPILFADVLRRFFALYAAINTVVQLSVQLNNVKGVVKQWPPAAGAQALL